jgi:hypothetical protein
MYYEWVEDRIYSEISDEKEYDEERYVPMQGIFKKAKIIQLTAEEAEDIFENFDLDSLKK